MQLFTISENLICFLEQQRADGLRIAFVPTMGALHAGHLSLIQLGKQKADLVVCSIFVNPTQFNNVHDLNTYPRMLDRDARMLELAGCQVLFAPDAEQIYPPGLDTQVHLELGMLDQVMEGSFRPGHFKGMLQVVNRLLNLVEPHVLIMGQKDFQQYTLVQHMISALQLPVQLVVGPTLRETDGLAMSSRNVRLTHEMRTKAPCIFQILQHIREHIEDTPIDVLQKNAISNLISKGLKPEYVEIVDSQTLQAVIQPSAHTSLVACIAAWAGDVRLIDNLVIKC